MKKIRTKEWVVSPDGKLLIARSKIYSISIYQNKDESSKNKAIIEILLDLASGVSSLKLYFKDEKEAIDWINKEVNK